MYARRAAHHARSSCARSPRSSTSSCCAAATPRSASSTTCSRDLDGSDYADPLAMSRALADAAAEAGIGLTLLPVLYERAGFDADAARRPAPLSLPTRARRARAAARIRAAGRPLVNAGVAIHSLRAASAGVDRRAARARRRLAGPIHIHVAEQTARGRRLPAATGARPIEWLARQARLDRALAARACHARERRTRSTRSRRAAPASSSARAPRPTSATASPTCPAGSLPACRWRSAPTARRRATGARSCAWLEYGQRLGAAPAQRRRRAGARRAVDRGAALRARARRRRGRGGRPWRWGLVAGARADLLVVDPRDDALLGLAPIALLDALVFAARQRHGAT